MKYFSKNREKTFTTFLWIFFLLFFSANLSAQAIPDVPPPTRLENADQEYISKVYQKALENYSQKKYQTSLRFIWHVLRSDVSNFNLRYLSAHDYWGLKDYPRATKEFERCIRYQPQEASSYIDLTLLFLQRKFYVSAGSIAYKGITALRSAKKEIPTKLYNVFARSFLLRKDAKSALQIARQAKTTFDQNDSQAKDQFEALILEARALQALGKFEEAEMATQWALSLKQGDPYCKNLLGYIYETWAIALTRKKNFNDQEKIASLKKQAETQYSEVLSDLELNAEMKKVAKRNLARLLDSKP